MLSTHCYAVREGFQTGLFKTWPECKPNVQYYPGSVYQPFSSEAEALAWLNAGLDDTTSSDTVDAPTSSDLAKATKELRARAKTAVQEIEEVAPWTEAEVKARKDAKARRRVEAEAAKIAKALEEAHDKTKKEAEARARQERRERRERVRSSVLLTESSSPKEKTSGMSRSSSTESSGGFEVVSFTKASDARAREVTAMPSGPAAASTQASRQVEAKQIDPTVPSTKVFSSPSDTFDTRSLRDALPLGSSATSYAQPDGHLQNLQLTSYQHRGSVSRTHYAPPPRQRPSPYRRSGQSSLSARLVADYESIPASRTQPLPEFVLPDPPASAAETAKSLKPAPTHHGLPPKPAYSQSAHVRSAFQATQISQSPPAPSAPQTETSQAPQASRAALVQPPQAQTVSQASQAQKHLTQASHAQSASRTPPDQPSQAQSVSQTSRDPPPQVKLPSANQVLPPGPPPRAPLQVLSQQAVQQPCSQSPPEYQKDQHVIEPQRPQQQVEPSKPQQRPDTDGYTPPRGSVIVYTDGSAYHNNTAYAQAGWGVFFEDPKHSHLNEARRMTGEQSSDRAELMALIRAIQLCSSDANLFGCQLILMTDSQYSIDCVYKWARIWHHQGWTNSQGFPIHNGDLIRQLDAEVRHRHPRPILRKVKAHIGILGNEVADRMAKLGAYLPIANSIDLSLRSAPPVHTHSDSPSRNPVLIR